MNGRKFLLRNKGIINKQLLFEDVTARAQLDLEKNNSFVTWFWDYDNDGWLDILAGDYSFTKSLGYYAAAERMKKPLKSIGEPALYHNNGNGTFSNVTQAVGLFKSAFAMGSNFGDIDNDGYLDMFLGTGNPNFNSLIPNKMFLSKKGKKFVDVTASALVGSLQKGHGVAFADMDNDGDQDIYIQMGGAYIGDAFQNSFFLNPGQLKHNWINISLEGIVANKAAIGTRLKLSFMENGQPRHVFRDVNSGGSFGASPLRREIGIGSAAVIQELTVQWPGDGKVQVFKNILANQFIKITEGSNKIEKVKLKTFAFKRRPSQHHHHVAN